VSDDPEEATDYFQVGLTAEASAAYERLSDEMDGLSELDP
jgi:hypothetical protein